jgi:hypothetical protein
MQILVRLICPTCDGLAGNVARDDQHHLVLTMLTRAPRPSTLEKRITDPRPGRPTPPDPWWVWSADELTWPCRACRTQPAALLRVEADQLAAALDLAKGRKVERLVVADVEDRSP